MTTPSIDAVQIHDSLSKIKGCSILVIGDFMVDEYLRGDTKRISPEAPVPVVRLRQRQQLLGGAANVARNLVGLGVNTKVAGFVGCDREGDWIKKEFERLSIDTNILYQSESRQTTRKTRIVAHRAQLARIDREDHHPITTHEAETLVRKIEKASWDTLIISDYGKGTCTPDLITKLIKLGRESGRPVLVDPKGRDFTRYRGATLLSPNRQEAERATGFPIKTLEALKEAGQHLLDKLEIEALLITLGEAGMALFESGKPEQIIPTWAREVYDVTGAGDTVIAVIGAGIAAGIRFQRAAELANLAAGLVIGKAGTAAISSEELFQAVISGRVSLASKFKTPPEAIRTCAEMQNAGRRIVFTNGCFDLLHFGHIKFLEQARAKGDVLMVAVNSDESVRLLKGEDRPFIHDKERVYTLSALSCVDVVTIFEDETPLRLLEQIKPDVLVKGNDYSLDEVVGKDLVLSYGGTVELIPVIQGYSTTGLAADVAQRLNR